MYWVCSSLFRCCRVPKLTTEQKCEIATKDIAELTHDIERFKEKASQDIEAERVRY